MAKKRKQHSEQFKAKVALEEVRGVWTLSELSTAFRVHRTLITQWYWQLVNGATTLFSRAAGTGFGRKKKSSPSCTRRSGR